MKDKNVNIITRTYKIIPVESNRNEWYKRVLKFAEADIEKKRQLLFDVENESYSKKGEKEHEKRVDSCKKRLESSKKQLEDFNNGIVNKKLIKDYTYNLVSESMISEVVRKNIIISNFYQRLLLAHQNDPDITTAECLKIVDEVVKEGCRVNGSKKGTLYEDIGLDVDNPLNGYGFAFMPDLKSKLKKTIKEGLLNGKCSLPSYKIDSPFNIASTHMGFSHDYDTVYELLEHFNGKTSPNLYFDFGSHGLPTIARFKICTGTNWKNKEELMYTMKCLYDGTYKHCGSKIRIDKNNKNDILLSLTMETPFEIKELKEDNVIGTDVGTEIPAFCSLSNAPYIKARLGRKDDFLRVRGQIRAEKNRIKSNARCSCGGHGRKKKLKAIEKFSCYEKNWARTYNHKISSDVIKFALKNNAKYINLEYITKDSLNNRILSNWSYYQLQNFIEYKAKKYGIEVRYVNPCYTSQVCSKCGPRYNKSFQK